MKAVKIIKETIRESKLFRLALRLKYNPVYNIYLLNRIEKKARILEESLPQYLLIENTNICNASCLMCGYKAMTRPRGVMDNKLFFDIIDQYRRKKDHGAIGIVGMGEPLLDPSLFEKIRYAAGRGLDDIIIFTNGSLLNKENVKGLLNSGLKKIFVSIDGFNKEEYELIRVGLRWEEAMDNLLRLLTENRKMVRPIEIELRVMILNRWIDTAKRGLIKRIKDLGAKVELSNLEMAHDWACQIKFDNLKYRENHRYTKRLPCYRLWSGLQILWNGDIALCCLDCDGKVILGNIGDGLDKIWSGMALNKIRDAHLNGDFETLDLCKFCYLEEPWPR